MGLASFLPLPCPVCPSTGRTPAQPQPERKKILLPWDLVTFLWIGVLGLRWWEGWDFTNWHFCFLIIPQGLGLGKIALRWGWKRWGHLLRMKETQ